MTSKDVLKLLFDNKCFEEYYTLKRDLEMLKEIIEKAEDEEGCITIHINEDDLCYYDLADKCGFEVAPPPKDEDSEYQEWKDNNNDK